MNEKKLPVGVQVIYGFGMMGWSIMINLIAVILVYFYEPPANSGLPKFITQAVLLGIFNAIALITTTGRFFDAVFDPLIAQLSDRSKNPKGRRTPFMRIAIIPSVVFCCLVFFPLTHAESTINIFWLAFMLIGFYVSTTTFVIPYNALLPQLAHTPKQKVSMSSWQSVGYVVGIGLSANFLNIAKGMRGHFSGMSTAASLQYSVIIFAIIAGIAMCVPAFGINEQKYTPGKPLEVTLMQALKQTLGNKNFRFFIVADFTYFMALTLITSGLIYFITVLLQLPETLARNIMAVMVLVSFMLYPLINYTARKKGKKGLVIFSFFMLAGVFGVVFFLGKLPFAPEVQIFALVSITAIPFSMLNILPIAILAEVIDKDKKDTGTNKEALYFAVRYFFVKIAQTLGIALFSMMLNYGKDVGHDLGIRLNGVIGLVLCLIAAAVFTGFKDVETAKAE